MSNNVWEDVYQSQEWGKYPGEDLIRFVARNFYKAPDRRKVNIIELGCGPGANIWYLAREGFSFVGIDGSETAIERAKKRLDNECAGWEKYGKLIVGDVGTIPFNDNSFHAVIDNECIYCNTFEKSIDIYAEARRLLIDGGKIYSRTFATGSWGDATGEKAGDNAWYCSEGPCAGKGLVRFTCREDIPKLLAGFGNIKVDLLTRSDGNSDVKEWIITAEKMGRN